MWIIFDTRKADGTDTFQKLRRWHTEGAAPNPPYSYCIYMRYDGQLLVPQQYHRTGSFCRNVGILDYILCVWMDTHKRIFVRV